MMIFGEGLYLVARDEIPLPLCEMSAEKCGVGVDACLYGMSWGVGYK
jgi:hypothetical protein